VRRDVESGVEAKIGEQLGEDGAWTSAKCFANASECVPMLAPTSRIQFRRSVGMTERKAAMFFASY
jgi:hypothetical protein